jgi:hypothetical protein
MANQPFYRHNHSFIHLVANYRTDASFSATSSLVHLLSSLPGSVKPRRAGYLIPVRA